MVRIKKDGSFARFFIDDFLDKTKDIIDAIPLGKHPNLGEFMDTAAAHPGIRALVGSMGQKQEEALSFYMTIYGLAWVWKTGRIIYCEPGIENKNWKAQKAFDLFQEDAVLLLNPPASLCMANGAHVAGVMIINSPFERRYVANVQKAADYWFPVEGDKRTVLAINIGEVQNTLCVNYQFYIAGELPIQNELDIHIKSVKDRYETLAFQANLQDKPQEADRCKQLVESVIINQTAFQWACQMLSAKKDDLVVETKQGMRVKLHKDASPKKRKKSHVKMYFKWEPTC